ncbi:hypothetical protein TanjilG_22838 [Lupinus angustifolius]|uniref:Uncharacterized protein n=1 Tax=Lupinus angustifolius TaxID=3871 RepID=A0A4P1RI97_LUPAN|nr:hypothetical protein TanjilG_22838 [Lupinus angustifolius]
MDYGMWEVKVLCCVHEPNTSAPLLQQPNQTYLLLDTINIEFQICKPTSKSKTLILPYVSMGNHIYCPQVVSPHGP